jgi:hypothetical protein
MWNPGLLHRPPDPPRSHKENRFPLVHRLLFWAASVSSFADAHNANTERRAMNAAIACPKCRISLDAERYPIGVYNACQNCDSDLQMQLFPAVLRPPSSGQMGETILMDSEAGCFYHPNKKAVVPCAACGRFLCALCDIDLHGEHYCPNCVETGRRKGRFSALEHSRILYDEVALTLALMGVPSCGITTPMALYYAIRHWKSPISLVSRRPWRAPLALALSLLQLGVIGVLIAMAILEK